MQVFPLIEVIVSILGGFFKSIISVDHYPCDNVLDFFFTHHTHPVSSIP